MLYDYDSRMLYGYAQYTIYCNRHTLAYLHYEQDITLRPGLDMMYMGHLLKIDDNMPDDVFRFVLFEG